MQHKLLSILISLLLIPVAVYASSDPGKEPAVYTALNGIDPADMAKFYTPGSSSVPVLASDAAAFLRGDATKADLSQALSFSKNNNQELTGNNLLHLATGAPLYGRLSFTECDEVPMIREGQVLNLDTNYNLHGFVTSDSPITNITIRIGHSEPHGSVYPLIAEINFTPEEKVTCWDISKRPRDERKGLNDLVNPCGLRTGTQTFTMTATSIAQPEAVELIHVKYDVVLDGWLQLRKDNFSDNYSYAEDFFGKNTSKYLFKYKWRGGGSRKIILDPAWRSANLIEDEWGRIHKDAVPYFDQVRSYLKSTYFRVHGTDLKDKQHDSGVLLLNELVFKNSGTCIARFTQSQKYVSHHSLGTVVDLNTNLSVNSQWLRNKPIIYDAVKHHLVYNGIKEDGGIRYHDFTFTGDYKSSILDIPSSCVNYLLYELAFYRAGFKWGFYFDTSDAMHFTLTESKLEYFETGPYALRKVYVYE